VSAGPDPGSDSGPDPACAPGPDPACAPGPDPACAPALPVVVDPDPVRVGAQVRERIARGERAAGFVGDPDDPALLAFVADVVRPDPGPGSPGPPPG